MVDIEQDKEIVQEGIKDLLNSTKSPEKNVHTRQALKMLFALLLLYKLQYFSFSFLPFYLRKG